MIMCYTVAVTDSRTPVSGICVELCGSVVDCGPGQKCVFNGCGHVCIKARDCSVSDVVGLME